MHSAKKKIAILQNVFDPAYQKKAYSILICHDLRQGSTEALKKYYELLEWNETINFIYEKLPIYLIEIMPTLEYEPIFSRFITDACKREDFKNFIWVHARKWKADSERFLKLAHIFAKAEAEEQAREKKIQHAVLDIKKKFGKNAIVKGMNLEEGATAMDRNKQIGGHKA